MSRLLPALVALVGCGSGTTTPPAPRDYEGPLDASLTATDYGLVFPCEGTAAIHVDHGASPQVVGDLTCDASAFGDTVTVEGTLSGDFVDDTTLEGTVVVDVQGDEQTEAWSGFVEDDLLQGQFAGATVLQGYAITYEGSWLVTGE